jgi:hypothetical protein
MNKIDAPEAKTVIYEPCYVRFTEFEDDDDPFATMRTFKLVEKMGAKVIRQDKYTIVILSDGSKGISQCMDGDSFSRKKGLRIAYNRAMIAHLEKLTKELCHNDVE